MPTAEIITIGTELLLGEATDTNTCYIARALRSLGIDVYRTSTIGDNGRRIAQSVRESIGRAEIVITTGGLGPTVDDPTRDAIAKAIGVELEFHPELWEQIAARINRYGRKPTENQKRQAYIPIGAIVIENPVGTAPAFIVDTGRSVVIALPGVPPEMETLLTDAVSPYLQKRFNLHEIIKVHTLHASGIGEAWLDEQIGDLEILANPTVGLTAHSGIVSIHITAKGETEAEANRSISMIETDIRSRLGDNLFGMGGDTLEKVTLEVMAQRGWTLSCIESGLEGALLTRLSLSEHPAYFGGSVRVVRNRSLMLATEAARQEFHSSSALGVVLSNSSKLQDIYIVLVTPHSKQCRHLTFGGHPRSARRWASNMALDLLRRTALVEIDP